MKGEVVYLYAFDVAYEIVTSKVQEILAQKPFPFTIRTEHTFPRDVPLYQPLAVEPPFHSRIGNRPVTDAERAAYQDWIDRSGEVSDRSALLMLGLR